MAEELDIRSIWNNSKEKEDPASLSINVTKIKGTKTTLYWVKFILWIEFWLTIIGAPLAIYLFQDHYDSNATIAYALVCFGYLFYYQFLIRAINRFNYDRDVIHNLKKVYSYLRFYLLHYKVVIWISVFLGALMSIFEAENLESLDQMESVWDWIKFISILTFFLSIFGGIMTFLIHLIYSRKIKRLKRMVSDFEREE